MARFKVTVSGNQTDRIAFSRDAGSDGCSLKIDGTLRESWNYARGKGVVFEFRKLFGRVVFGRAGRPGDGSFAAPGNLTRQATGSYYYLAPGGSCTAVSLVTPTCGKRFRVRSDLSLGFSKNPAHPEARRHRRTEEEPRRGMRLPPGPSTQLRSALRPCSPCSTSRSARCPSGASSARSRPFGSSSKRSSSSPWVRATPASTRSCRERRRSPSSVAFALIAAFAPLPLGWPRPRLALKTGDLNEEPQHAHRSGRGGRQYRARRMRRRRRGRRAAALQSPPRPRSSSSRTARRPP